MVLLFCTAFASDGVRELSFEDTFDRSAVIVLARIAEPMVERRELEVPLPTTPPRSMQWSVSVQRFEVLEVLHRRHGPEPSGTIEAVSPTARRDLDRHVRYELTGSTRGIMHERYAGSLDAKARTPGQQVVVFLGAPSTSSSEDPVDQVWDTSVGNAWRVIGMDAPASRKRIEKRAGAR